MTQGAAVLCFIAVSGLVSVARAELSEQHAAGFSSTHHAQVSVSPRQALRQFARIGQWWDAAHSFSGKSSALKLDLRIGGCFCERAGGLQVRHLDVVRVEPERRIVLTGGLGPLQTMAVQAVLEVEAIANANGTELRWTYRVAGGNPATLASVAKPVDQVMGMQFQRWVKALQ